MTSYTLWNGAIPSGTSSVAGGARTDGIQLTFTAACQLTAIGFYVPSAETVLTGSSFEGLLWSTVTGNTGTLLDTQAGSGTWTAGAWNWITLAAPFTPSLGTTYVAAISSPNWLQFLHTYWAAGNPGAAGVTSGPVTAPGVAGAVAGLQQPFTSAAATFPNSISSGGTWYGVDVLVTTSTPASPSGLLMAGII